MLDLSRHARHLGIAADRNVRAPAFVEDALFLLDLGARNEFHARQVSLTLTNHCLLNPQFL